MPRPRAPLSLARCPVCDDPQPRDDAPAHGTLAPLLTPTPEPNPNRCWYWAGKVFLRLNPALPKPPKRRDTAWARRSPNSVRFPRGIITPKVSCNGSYVEPHHFLHVLFRPDVPLPHRFGPCRDNTRFFPWPRTGARFSLRCINPFHRIHISAEVASPNYIDPLVLKDIRHAQSFREPDDFLRDAEPHFRAIDPPCIETLLSTSLNHPDDPPYAREEIIYFLRKTAASLDLPSRWRDALHRQLPEQPS
jgi:hypothetical protein